MSEIKWKTKKVNIDELTVWDKNPRVITEKGKKDLTESIIKFGVAEPIAVNTDMTVIGGHARLEVLKELGYKDVLIMCPDRQLTESEVEELNVRLNKNIAGDWDWQKLAEFDSVKLQEWGFKEWELDFTPEPDDAPNELDGDENVDITGDSGKTGRFLLVYTTDEERRIWCKRLGIPADTSQVVFGVNDIIDEAVKNSE